MSIRRLQSGVFELSVSGGGMGGATNQLHISYVRLFLSILTEFKQLLLQSCDIAQHFQGALGIVQVIIYCITLNDVACAFLILSDDSIC